MAKLVSTDLGRDANAGWDGGETAAYMSPEQAQGQPIDVRSEVFSFGAVLYELLAGRRAFEGPSTAAVLSAGCGRATPLAAPTALDAIVPVSAQGPGAAVSHDDRCAGGVGRDCGHGRRVTNHQLRCVPANLSADPESEYFGDGLAEEIINLLVQTPGLKVIANVGVRIQGSRKTSAGSPRSSMSPHVLEGSVRKAGNRIRVTAQLISARDGSHLWSKRYDRELADVFAIQDEIAQAIAAQPHQTFAGRLRRADGPRRVYPFTRRCSEHAITRSEGGLWPEPRVSRGSDRDGSGVCVGSQPSRDAFLMRLTAQAMPAHDAAVGSPTRATGVGNRPVAAGGAQHSGQHRSDVRL